MIKFVENQDIDRKQIPYHSLSQIVKENRGKKNQRKGADKSFEKSI